MASVNANAKRNRFSLAYDNVDTDTCSHLDMDQSVHHRLNVLLFFFYTSARELTEKLNNWENTEDTIG